ncbi:MAG: TonB-dependent receptor [Candidatus Fermentibacteraceae bacterium]
MKNHGTGLVIVVLLTLTSVSPAGVTGVLTGRVTDTGGAPVVGATVMVEGTQFGAMTDSDGEYTIIALDPAEYTITARMVGMETRVTDGVGIVADQVTRVDFRLGIDPAGNTVIRVTQSRSSILHDLPATLHIIDPDELQTTPTGRIIDILASKPGVVSSGGSVHVRGGRTGEVDYLLDGISMRSPMSNTFSAGIPLGAISGASIMTGGLSAEYGNAMSGIVNLVGDEGSEEYRASLTGSYGGMISSSSDDGQRVYMEQTDTDLSRLGCRIAEVKLSGPEPLTNTLLPAMGIRLPGTTTVSFSGRANISGRDTLDSRGYWENNWNSDASGVMKVTFRPTARTSVSVSGLYSYSERGWNEWAWSRYHRPGYIDGVPYFGRSQDYALPVRFSENYGINGTINRLVTDLTSVRLTLSSRRFMDWQRVRQEDGGYLGEELPPSYWLTQYLPEARLADSLGYYHTGTHPNVWLDSRADVNTVKFDLDSHPTGRFWFKSGVSASLYDLYEFNVYALQYGNVYVAQWDAEPRSMAGFFQGNVRLSGGVVLTGGLRLDGFDPNTTMFSQEELTEIEVDPKWQLSPRVGLSVPFGERSVFFTTYGHYFQMPPMSYLFLESSYNFSQGRAITGNPDLDAERTSAFEVGTRYMLADRTELSMAVYYKDITGLVSTEQHLEGAYYYFDNDDSHGMARGFEVTLGRESGGTLSGYLTYSMGIAKGRFSTAFDPYNYGLEGVALFSREDNYLDWDQLHTAGASLQLTGFQGEGPSIGGFRPFENSSLQVTWNYGSGFPYTLPPSGYELIALNTERYPFTMETDLRCARRVPLAGLETEFQLTVQNLFDRRNVFRIYDTALFRTTGDPTGEMGNPRAWSPSRLFMLSASVAI